MNCPRCQAANRDAARFCAACGMSLEAGIDGTQRAGRVRHPRPAAPPPDFVPCGGAAQVYFRWESSLGGERLIGTEGLNVIVFNAGYPLRDVLVLVSGEGREGAEVFTRQYELAELPQGRETTLEVPSYELREPIRVLKMELVSAEFAREC